MGFQQGFRVNTNTASLNTYRSYAASQAGMEKNIERLSSGLRINKASDDAAGLAISDRMSNQIRGMQQANRNVQQGNNLLQTAEGAMNEVGNILGRMRELAVQSASDTVSNDDRSSIDLEFEQLKSEIDRIAKSTTYNGTGLIDGSQDGLATDHTAAATSEKITLQVGADNNTQDQLSFNLANFSVTKDDGSTATEKFAGVALTDGSSGTTFKALHLSTAANSQTAITSLDQAIEGVNDQRATVGAYQNRLEFTSSNLMSSIQNNSASVSTIRDADFAAEAADLAKNQILVQSGTSMLAQANGLSQNVLALIR
jgi:flagellin